MAITLRSRDEIAAMREAGRIVARTYEVLAPHIVPGVTTAELDRIAEAYIRGQDAVPVYKGYGAAPARRGYPEQPAFPATICVAVNDVIVHGIPRANERLREGDIIGVDVGVKYKGWVGDSCVTYGVGKVDPESQRLMDVARRCLDLGIEQARPGRRVGDIGAAIQSYAEAQGFSVVREYGGHGVGRDLHGEPFIHHHGKAGSGLMFKPGMTFTIEPMINMGRPEAVVQPDRWTVRTADGSRSAQYEHSIAITDNGPLILTLP